MYQTQSKLYFLLKQNLLISGEKMSIPAEVKGVPRDSYTYWNLFRQGIALPSFIIVEYVWQTLGRRTFLPPLREQPRKGPSS